MLLTTQVSKLALFWLLKTACCVLQEKFPGNCITNLFGQDGWILVPFFASLWTPTPSQFLKSRKQELGQYPAILTSRSAINPNLSCFHSLWNSVCPVVCPAMFYCRNVNKTLKKCDSDLIPSGGDNENAKLYVFLTHGNFKVSCQLSYKMHTLIQNCFLLIKTYISPEKGRGGEDP